MNKINGPVLMGFQEWFEHGVMLGAAVVSKPKPKGPPQKTPKKQTKPGAFSVPRSQTMQAHGKVLTAARVTAAKAVKSAASALRAAAKKPPATHVGVAAQAKTPKQKQAVAKAQAATAKAGALAQKAHAAGQSTRTAAIALAKRAQAQKAFSDKLRGKTGTTRVRGNVEIGALHDYYTAMGADPDPNNPGFLTDGTSDPAYAAATPAVPAGLDLGLDPIDTGATLPPPPDISTYIPDLTLIGGVLYNGEKGTPDGYCGSYGLFTRKTDIKKGWGDSPGVDGNDHFGFVYGHYNDEGPEKGIPWGDEIATGRWNHVHGRHALLQKIQHDVVDLQAALASNSTNNPAGVSYGPLIGNPAMKDFVGMRVDAQGRMGWYPQEAPDWLTAPLKQAAALTAQAAQKAAAEAAAADAAVQAKTAADQAAAQAAQDAANALAESQEASAANVAQSQQETMAQQMMVEQAKTGQASQAAQMQQEQQASDMLLQQAQRQQAYYTQHPELEFRQQRPQRQQQDQGGDEQDQGQGDDQDGDDHRGGYMGQPDDGQDEDGGDYEDQQ